MSGVTKYIHIVLIGGLVSCCGAQRSTENTGATNPVNPQTPPVQGSAQRLQSEPKNIKDIVFIASTDVRTKSPDTYFDTEYGRINERRNHFGFTSADGNQRPSMIVGLAMSGGGIRANAFHMGLLSGLYAEKIGPASLLERIDYTSSVSGGSWANSALWAWPDGLEGMFQCLDAAAGQGKTKAVQDNSGCADAVAMLRTDQMPELFAYPGHQRKEEWQREITLAHLRHGCDLFLSQEADKKCESNLVTKPYFVINSTHSKEFPFETTFDSTGTVVDEGSKHPDGNLIRGKDTTGFFINFRGTEAKWDRRKFFENRIPGGGAGLKDGSQLSMVAAHSSAFLRGKGLPAAALTFYFQVSENGDRLHDDRIREKYKVTDGGASDNTGIVPLVDRGADVVIASYMGKERSLFEDFKQAKNQVHRLFGCDLATPTNVKSDHPRVQQGHYSCPTSPSPQQKQILHVHPWPSNINDFFQYLDSKTASGDTAVRKVVDFLKEDRKQHKDKAGDSFPQTPTGEPRYDERLIRAYYLLGKFTAQNDVAPFLRDRLAADSR